LKLLQETTWDSIFTASTVESSWDNFRNIFHKVLDSVAPIKSVRLKQRTEPWLTSDILALIKERDRLLYMFKKEKKKDFYKSYCKYRNLVQKEVKRAKSEYITNQIEENKNDSKSLWKHLKDLGYSSKSQSSAKVVLNIDDKICFDDKKIANYFNDFFTNIASMLVSKLPAFPNVFKTSSSIFKEYYSNKVPSEKKFYIKTVSEEYVYKELCSLNPMKSTGLDNIPARFIKDGAIFLKIPITFIINKSIVDKEVPTELKAARVKPLFKKNFQTDVGNYRPVSILCIVSKVLERCVYNQLESFLAKNNIIYQFQSGFRTNFSTESCLVHLTDFVKSQTAKGLYTGMIMLDLQKAFDTVDHTILCEKLKTMGVQSVEWFHSYLTGRKQTMHVNDTFSDSETVTCGVPQGSILGPLLFLCYVNDMEISISKDCKLLLYADDSAIIFSHQDPNVISKKLGCELANCNNWLVDNKLSLHIGKTECILFGSKRKIKKIENFSVICNNQTIKSQKSVKYLGHVLDNTLSGNKCANDIISKVNSRLKFMYRHNSVLDFNTRKTLCNSLIQCLFDYACSAWYNNLGKTLKSKLQITQNKVVRFILNVPPRTTLTCSDFHKLGILKLNDRVKQLSLNHVHKKI